MSIMFVHHQPGLDILTIILVIQLVNHPSRIDFIFTIILVKEIDARCQPLNQRRDGQARVV